MIQALSTQAIAFMSRTNRASIAHTLSPDLCNVQAAEVLQQFRIVFNEVRAHFHQVEKRAGIGGASVWALSLVNAQPGLAITDLSREMHVHQSTASNLVKQLLSQKLIRAEKCTVDRRSTQLYIEPTGRSVLMQTPGPHEGVLPHALCQMPTENLVALKENLCHLIDILRADETAGSIPLAQL